jgi:hypothetical protein
MFLTALPLFTQTAAAHHLDNYDERIRATAELPSDWFACNSSADCALVSVPCQSDLAVNASHADETRASLVRAFSFCLGSSLHDSESACHERQCATGPKKR